MTTTEARREIDRINDQLMDAIGDADKFGELVRRRNELMAKLKVWEKPVAAQDPIRYVSLNEKIRNWTRGMNG